MKKGSKQNSREELARAILAPRLKRVGYLLWLVSFALFGYALSRPDDSTQSNNLTSLPSYNEQTLEAGLLPISEEEKTYRLAPGELATPYLYLCALAFAAVATTSLTIAYRYLPVQISRRK